MELSIELKILIEKYQNHLQLLFLNHLTIHINNLKKQLQEIKLQAEIKSSEEEAR